MAHVRQEFALRAAGGLGGLGFFLEFAGRRHEAPMMLVGGDRRADGEADHEQGAELDGQ